MDLQRPEGRIGKPPLCRVDVRIGTVVLDACIDSGATYTLLSERKWSQIREECGELSPAEDVNLYGNSGKKITLHGRARIQFWIGKVHYDYAVLIGEPSGVDMLIGMDWLIAVQARLDFDLMTVKIGPMQEVDLRTTHREMCPLSNGIGFIRAHG